MRSVIAGERNRLASRKWRAIKLSLDSASLRRGEVYLRVFLIHAGDALDLPVPVSNLCQLLAVQIVQIEMAIAGALAGPQKTLLIRQEAQVVVYIDPVFILFGERNLRFPAARIGETEDRGASCARLSRSDSYARRESCNHATRAPIRRCYPRRCLSSGSSSPALAPVLVSAPTAFTTPTRAVGFWRDPAIG